MKKILVVLLALTLYASASNDLTNSMQDGLVKLLYGPNDCKALDENLIIALYNLNSFGLKTNYKELESEYIKIYQRDIWYEEFCPAKEKCIYQIESFKRVGKEYGCKISGGLK